MPLLLVLVSLWIGLAGANSSKPGFSVYTPRVPNPAAPQMAPTAPRQLDSVEELERARQNQLKAYQEINQANPFAQKDGSGVGTPGTLPIAPKSDLGRLLANSWLQKYLRFLAREDFQALVLQMTEHPNRLWLIGGQVAWLVFFLALRAWRLSRVAVTQWGKVLWISLWSFIVYVAGAFIGVPWLVFGDLWAKLLKLIF